MTARKAALLTPAATAPQVNWWRGAITGPDNVTIDPTFLCVMYAVFIVLPLILISLIGISLVDVFVNGNDYSPVSLGGGIAAVIAAVGAFIGTCAALLAQDKKPQPPSTTTSVTQTTVP